MKPIVFDSGKIYLDNYRTCFTVNGPGRNPCMLYKLPPCATSQKIVDCVICYSPLTCLPVSCRGYRPSVLALTNHHWLLRYDVDNGELLQQVYLSRTINFRHISYEATTDAIIVLKSTQNRPCPAQRAVGLINHVLVTLAVFAVFPLQFCAMIEINKQVFGMDIVDAMLSQQTLVTLHNNGFVRIYSWLDIVEQGKQFDVNLCEMCEQLDGCVGDAPHGVPINLRLTARPPVLFEVKVANHDISLSSKPWHYIMAMPGEDRVFSVRSVASHRQAEGGLLAMPMTSVDPDKCVFHPDESGRLMHIGAREVDMLKLTESTRQAKDAEIDLTTEPQYRIDHQFIIKPNQIRSLSINNVTVTASGRIVKRSANVRQGLLDFDTSDTRQTVQSVAYEDDLDLLVVTCVAEGDEYCYGDVQIHDNQTGQQLCHIPLLDPWKEFCDNEIFLDQDRLVHIVAAPLSKFHCSVYKLCEDICGP